MDLDLNEGLGLFDAQLASMEVLVRGNSMDLNDKRFGNFRRARAVCSSCSCSLASRAEWIRTAQVGTRTHIRSRRKLEHRGAYLADRCAVKDT